MGGTAPVVEPSTNNPRHNSMFFYGFKSVLGTAWAEAARGGKRRPNPPLIEPDGRHDGKPDPTHQSQLAPVTARPNISFPRAKSSSSVDRTRFLGSHPTSPLAKRRQPAVLTRSGVEPNTSRAILRTLLRVTAPPAVRPRATMSRPLFSGLGNRKSVKEPRDTLIPDRRICALGEFSFLLKLRPDQTVRRWRPFARRRLITFWPSAVLMRFRNPWQVFRLLLVWLVCSFHGAGSLWFGEAGILCLIRPIVKTLIVGDVFCFGFRTVSASCGACVTACFSWVR